MHGVKIGFNICLLINPLKEFKMSKLVTIEKMIDNFLSWKLPDDFYPDGGISFNKLGYRNNKHCTFHPIGTNLFTASQAKAMFEHCLELEKMPIHVPNPADCIDVGIVVQDYEKFVKGLFQTKTTSVHFEQDFIWNLTHAALGIGGEAGEVVDLVKKTFANNRTLDGDKLVKELGDLMFYIQAMCNTINIPLITVLQANVNKLTARFPEGYLDEAALARADEKVVITPPPQAIDELPHGYQMSSKALGKEYKQFIDVGWTLQQMINFDLIRLIASSGPDVLC